MNGIALGQVPLRGSGLGQEELVPLPPPQPRPLMREILAEAQRRDLAKKFRAVVSENPTCIAPLEKMDLDPKKVELDIARIISGEAMWSDDWPPLIARIEACYAALPSPIPGWVLPLSIGAGVVGLAWFLSSRKW